MKKTVYLLMAFIGIALTSCEPMEDIHNQIDAQIEGAAAGSVDFTLTEDNYKKDLGLNYANFNSVADAKELIPGLLSDLYPSLGKNIFCKCYF